MTVSFERPCVLCSGSGTVGGQPCRNCQGKGTARQEKRLDVKIPAGTPSGRVLRVKGRGVKTKSGEAGDLLAKVSVVVPQRLTDEAKAAVETLRAADDGFDPRAEMFARSQV